MTKKNKRLQSIQWKHAAHELCGVVDGEKDLDWDVHFQLTGLIFPSRTAKETLTVGLLEASCFHALRIPECAAKLKDC